MTTQAFLHCGTVLPPTVAGALTDQMCVTCRLGLHVSGKLATDTVVVGADVVKAPSSQLLGTVELSTYKVILCHFCMCTGCRHLITSSNS